MKENILVLQSGGPTSVMNAALVGLLDENNNQGQKYKIYGAKYGLHGLLNDELIDLTLIDNENKYKLYYTPGAYLGVWRHKVNQEEISRMYNSLLKNKIGFLILIGGNGTVKFAQLFQSYIDNKKANIKILCIPNTIDNDINGIEYSPGYGSAVNFLRTSVTEIERDLKSLWDNKKITIFETMGRNTGWLAASTILARKDALSFPNLIYIPEFEFNLRDFLKKVERVYKSYGFAMIVVSEGIKGKDGNVLKDDSLSETDKLGRQTVGGVSTYLSKEINNNIGYTARYVVPSIWQRTSMVNASKIDLEISCFIGRTTIQQIQEIHSNGLIASYLDNDKRIKSKFYKLTDISENDKKYPESWFNEKLQLPNNKFCEFISPYIENEENFNFENLLN